MRHGKTFVTCLGALLLASCGDAGETKTVVQTVVQTQPAPTTSSPEPATGQTVEADPASPGESTQDPPPGSALPGGVATVQGRYRVTYKDYSPSGYNLNGTYKGKVTQWNAETTCANGECQVELRRALDTGGFKNYRLRASGEKKYTGTFSAKADACGADPEAKVRERVSIQTSRIQDLGEIPTVTGLDIYVKQTGVCRERGRRISATATWKGARIGP